MTHSDQELRSALALTIGRKSVVIALVLWLLLGGLGLHRMYLGKIGSGVVMALLTIIGASTAGVGVGILFLAIVFVWWIIDFFVIFFAARRHNRLHDVIRGK